MRSKRRRFRPLVLGTLGALIVAKIVALSPSSLEEGRVLSKPVDAAVFVENSSENLAPGIPKDRIAEYSVENFSYVSVQNSQKQWRMEANKAFLYSAERLVHSKNVKAFLYDPDGKTTVVVGREAKYFMNKKDLEVFGDVKTHFPDGFEINSDYLRYQPSEQRILIPNTYQVDGKGEEKDGQKYRFVSRGMDYLMKELKVILPQAVRFTLQRPQEETVIDADQCIIFRKERLAKFTMNPARPLDSRFVHISQPDLFTRSRRANLNYGDFRNLLEYLTAEEDVLIKEKSKEKSLRYATAGRADFNTHSNIIVLTKFPQVYQDQDTVTGDVILMHRDTDVVEIEHSNAYSRGSEPEGQ